MHRVRKTLSRETDRRESRTQRRRGAIIVLFAIMLVMMLGLLGLAIDGGFLLAAHRSAQDMADTAALAYAQDRLIGKTKDDATTTARTFVKTHNGYSSVPDTDIVLNETPTLGPYQEDGHVEAIVTLPVRTYFIHILGINPNQKVQARAVARWNELRTAGAGAVVLDPRVKFSPGFNVTGGGTIRVNGGIFDNNEGPGLDENGATVGDTVNGTKPAASGGQPNSDTGIYTTSFRSVGGVDVLDQFKNIDTGTATPNILHAGVLPIPDPLASLEAPSVSNGVVTDHWGKVSILNGGLNQSGNDPSFDAFAAYPTGFWEDTDGSGTVNWDKDTVRMKPGIYSQIAMSGGNIKMDPGIYVISAGGKNALSVTGGNVQAQGIMFYNTGANYDPLTGLPDKNDPFDPSGSSPPPGQPDTQYGDVTLNASMVFSPIDTNTYSYANSNIRVFNGILFYQRRMNELGVDIQGNSAAGTLSGTIYAKWSNFKISGQGTYAAQFLVGSMTVSGTGNVTFTFAGQGVGKAPAVYLVE